MTAYFRLTFEVEDPAKVSELRCWIRRDDGVAVYLNGSEIARDLLAPDAGYDSPAQGAVACYQDDGGAQVELPQLGATLQLPRVRWAVVPVGDLS